MSTPGALGRVKADAPANLELKPYRVRLVKSLRTHAAEHGFQYVDTAQGTLWGTICSRSDLRKRFP